MSFSVGDFLNPRPEDSRFDIEDMAISEAKLQSHADDNSAVAVWDEDELLVVFLRGYELKPV